MSLPENLPPLPPSTPPPLPLGVATSTQSLAYNQSQMMPPNQMSAAAYQQYYQQYMQYMYMYNTAAVTQQTQTPVVPYNYNNNNNIVPKQIISTTQPPPVITPSCVTSYSKETNAPKPTIKFNLKFQTQHKNEEASSNIRKSRFNNSINTNNLTNIALEQNNFKKQQEEKVTPVLNETPNTQITTSSTTTTTTVTATAADIVADINKWPAPLKAYCTKVYQHFQKQTTVSEDQVTKYLQQRITDTFKLKPDLNIDWNNEKMPEVNEIKLVAPFSQLQLQQQKRQQKIHEAAIAAAKAKAAELLAEKVKLKQQLAEQQKQQQQHQQTIKKQILPSSLAAEISRNKRKYNSRSRSASASSSSSTTSSSSSKSNSDSFISLSSKKTPNKNHSMMKIEKKKLKNIQINNVNGKKSFMLINSKATGKRKSSDETSDGEDEEDDEDDQEDAENNDEEFKQKKLLTTPNKFLSNKQKKMKANLLNRQKRFQLHNKNNNNNANKQKLLNRLNMRTLFSSISNDTTNEDANMAEVCIGLNQDLEKEYLRLTGPPEPHMIRPLTVLKKSLVHVLNKYSKSNDYRYICDQMKAIRQDLTVQMIQNEFTIEVYETHARIAIRNKDRDEFNQCQSQLKSLYSMIEKTGSMTKEQEENNAEFVGYRLLYNMLTKSHNDLNQVIKEIKRKYSTNQYLNHLLALRNAWHICNYVKFFRLYRECDEMSKCLIDLFIERERKLALKIIIKAYRPSIKLECVRELLAYESIQKCKDDLLAYKLSIQSLPLSDSSTTSTSTSTTTNTSLLSHSNKSTYINKSKSVSAVITRQTFEEVLDCKSCNIQF